MFLFCHAGAPIWPHNAYTMSDSTLTSVTFAPPVSSHTSPEELLIVSLQLLSDKHELVKETTVPWSKQTVIHALQPSSSYRLRVRYPMTPFSTAITVRTLAVGMCYCLWGMACMKNHRDESLRQTEVSCQIHLGGGP